MSGKTRQCEEPALEHMRAQLAQYDVDSKGSLRLRLDEASGVATLCIDNPARKNAFSGAMMAQFDRVLDQLEQWKEGRVLILYGTDSFFCSGADLGTVRNLPEHCGAQYISSVMQHNMKRLQLLPMVSVALVEGKALGGGVELITTCDMRVFAPDARMGFVHARLGVTPGFGGGVRLVSLIGPTRALELMLSGQLIDVERADRLGLVSHRLEAGLAGEAAVEATAAWFMRTYGTISVNASRAIKSIVKSSWDHAQMEAALAHEASVFRHVWLSEEHKKALASNIKHK